MNYLASKRATRDEQTKKLGSSLGTHDQSDSMTNPDQRQKAVADKSLAKILNDQNISEYDRMEAVR